MGLDVNRLETDKLAQFGDRFIQLTLVPKGKAEVFVDQAEIGFESDGLAVFGDRFIQFTLVPKGEAEVVMGLSVIGPDLMAWRNSAIASSSLCWSFRPMPRLLWARV